MNKIVIISLQDETLWIRPDQIEYIEAACPAGHPQQKIEVYLFSGRHFTVVAPEDIKKLMPFLLVLTTAEAVKEFCGPDRDIPF